ncbi:uncharacterized protein BJ171DRAFT_596088 [Polychytrium aggregatum]|uniref:uncharacterized protein n=1 Tax=Polychytrium aggregatum TaxID=110093 RepID=UPI0022FE75D1|nr:uncharacterized protein BJ171DRAFT_596088 [Polychytrium aggregatum]KAI9208303.1 hypothetical protein BJ171DRAFT_596088 [Polychytrium aggregatum]
MIWLIHRSHILQPGYDHGSREGTPRSHKRHRLFQSGIRTVIAANRLRNTHGVDVNAENPDLESRFSDEVSVTIVDYGARPDSHSIRECTSAEFATFLKRKRPEWSKVRWIIVSGINYHVVKLLTQQFDIHPLAVEDVLHSSQRIKTEFYESFVYMALRSIQLVQNGEATGARHPKVLSEQVNFFLFKDTFISIFESPPINFTAPILDRLQHHNIPMRKSEDVSFALCSVLDSVVDHYFPVLDAFQEYIAGLEQIIIVKPNPKVTKDIYFMTKEVSRVKRMLLPIRDAVDGLIREFDSMSLHGHVSGSQHPKTGANLVTNLTRIYLRDVEDHLTRIFAILDTIEEDARELINYIFNMISNSTNESMKTLAIVSLIFLPLSFLSGYFGMNFEYFDAIHLPNGLAVFWGLCGTVVVIMLVVLRLAHYF